MSERVDMSEHHDCGQDAAAYVLGALEPAEAETFRRHLEQCAVCHDEVDALTGVANALPMSAPQFAAPKDVRRDVLRAVRSEPKPRPAMGHRARFAWPSTSMALATLAIALVLAAAAVTAVVLTPGSSGGRVVRARVAGIAGSAEVRLSDGRAELIVRHLTPPAGGHVYEVWLKAPAAPPVPASVLFSVNASGGADVGIPANVHGISEILVTPEPHGGSPAPTHPPVITASLS